MQASTVNRHAPAPLTYDQVMNMVKIEDISQGGEYNLETTISFRFFNDKDERWYTSTPQGVVRYNPKKFDECLYNCVLGLMAKINLLHAITRRQTKVSAKIQDASIAEHIDLLFASEGRIRTKVEKKGLGCCGDCKKVVKLLFSDADSTLKLVLDIKNHPIVYPIDEDFCRMIAQGLKHKMRQAAAQSVQPPQTTTVNPVFAYADIQAAQQLAAQFLGN